MAGQKRGAQLYYIDKSTNEHVYMGPIPYWPEDPLEWIRKNVADPGEYLVKFQEQLNDGKWYDRTATFGPIAEGLGTMSSGRAPRPIISKEPLRAADSGLGEIQNQAFQKLVDRALQPQAPPPPSDADAFMTMAENAKQIFTSEQERIKLEREAERERQKYEADLERQRAAADLEKIRAQTKADQEMMIARMEKQSQTEKESMNSIMKIMESSHDQRIETYKMEAAERASRDQEFYKSMVALEQGRARDHMEIQTKMFDVEKQKMELQRGYDERFFKMQADILQMQKQHMEEIRMLQDRMKPWELLAKPIAEIAGKLADKVELKVGAPPMVAQMSGAKPKALPQGSPEPQPQPQQEELPVMTIEQLRKMTDEQLIAEVKASSDFAGLLDYLAQAIPWNYSRDKFLEQLLEKGGNSPEIRFKVRAITRLPDVMTFFDGEFYMPQATDPAEQPGLEKLVNENLALIKQRGKDWLEDFAKACQKWAKRHESEYF